jgi:hypothetical protein
MSKSEELKKKMICGDWIVIGKMLDITPKNAQQSFAREDSKRFPDIVKAIEEVIKKRDELLNDK